MQLSVRSTTVTVPLHIHIDEKRGYVYVLYRFNIGYW